MKLGALEGESWTKQAARNGFPILVEAARRCSPITYGEWDKEIVRRRLGHHVYALQYGHPAGVIGDACIEYAERTNSKVPPINLLVINGGKKLPGKGANRYINWYCREILGRRVNPQTMSRRDKLAIIDEAHRAIYSYAGWDRVLTAYELAQARPIERRALPRRKPNPRRWAHGPESADHKALKELVAENPKIVGLTGGLRGQTERLLPSGDRVDVLFKSIWCAVEVKTRSASWDEVHRGLFQCIKYREVLRASQVYEAKIPNAECILAVGGELPKDLKQFANLLRIQTYEELEDRRRAGKGA
jgi:hypothetical protein